MGLQNIEENVFHAFGSLLIWLWESFGNSVARVFTNPDMHAKTSKQASHPLAAYKLLVMYSIDIIVLKAWSVVPFVKPVGQEKYMNSEEKQLSLSRNKSSKNLFIDQHTHIFLFI